MTANNSSTQPLYRQVAKKITEDIEAGIRPPNSRIPSERELAEDFGISRMTARAAVNSLVHLGIVERRNRSRAYVAKPKYRFNLSSPAGLHEQLREIGITPGAKIIIAEKIPARSLNSEINEMLDLKKNDEVYRIVRLRTANSEPIAIENSYFPANLFPDLLDFNLTDSIYGILKKHFLVETIESVQEIEITFLSEQWADLMGASIDLPTLEIKRRSVTTGNRPFEFAHDIYRGDRLIFTTQSTGKTINPGAKNAKNL